MNSQFSVKRVLREAQRYADYLVLSDVYQRMTYRYWDRLCGGATRTTHKSAYGITLRNAGGRSFCVLTPSSTGLPVRVISAPDLASLIRRITAW